MTKKTSVDNVKGSVWFSKAQSRASEYANDPKKLNMLLEEASRKAESKKNGPLVDVRDSLFACFRLLHAYTKGEYTKIPWQSLLLIIASIVYFVMPIDLLPDFIPISGFFDDVSLVAWTMKTLKSDVDDFRAWETEEA